MLGDKPEPDRQAARRRRRRPPRELLDAGVDARATITEEGLRNDVNVGFQYISFWLGGRGAAGINNLMEDAATAEISRSQIWQWIRHGKVTREQRARGARRGDGRRSTPRSATRSGRRAAPTRRARSSSASRSRDDFPEFLTLPAYEYLD